MMYTTGTFGSNEADLTITMCQSNPTPCEANTLTVSISSSDPLYSRYVHIHTCMLSIQLKRLLSIPCKHSATSWNMYLSSCCSLPPLVDFLDSFVSRTHVCTHLPSLLFSLTFFLSLSLYLSLCVFFFSPCLSSSPNLSLSMSLLFSVS